MKAHFVHTILAGALFASLSIIPNAEAQQQPEVEPSAAPVPSQILRAKKVFVVSAMGDRDPRIAKYIGGPDGIYNQFYADVKSSGRFELVSAPADADLVLQVTLGLSPVIGYAGFKLSILDPKTNILLWTISEPIDPAILAKNARKNIAQSLSRLADDVKTVSSGPGATAMRTAP